MGKGGGREGVGPGRISMHQDPDPHFQPRLFPFSAQAYTSYIAGIQEIHKSAGGEHRGKSKRFPDLWQDS